MSGALRFVLVWSMVCFIATLAVCRPNLMSLAAVPAEAWLANVGIDMCLPDE